MYNKKLLSQIDLGKYKKPDAFKKDKIYNPTGKPIRDNQGQWKYPGQPTRIQSENITMKGVPYPVMAYPNVGRPQMMYPEQEYYFPGADYVDEDPRIPKKQLGGLARLTKSVGQMATAENLTNALSKITRSNNPLSYPIKHIGYKIAKQSQANERNLKSLLEGVLGFSQDIYFGQKYLYPPDYGPGKRDLNKLYFFGDETGFTPTNYDFGSDPGLDALVQKYGPLKAFLLNSSIQHGEPISGSSLMSNLDVYDKSLMYYDSLPSTESTKKLNELFDEHETDIIPFDVNAGDYAKPKFSLLANPVNPYDDIAGHMAFLKRLPNKEFELTSRDIWSFRPGSYDEKWSMDNKFKRAQVQLMDMFGKPFVLTQTNPIQFRKGGASKKYSRSLEATNYLLRENPLFKKKKSRKKKIYDPNSPYFQDGGELPADYQAFLDYSATAPENRRPNPDNPDEYDHYGMWDALGKPRTFEEALQMNPDWVPDEYDGYYHGFSVNPNTGIFLKSGKPGMKEGDTTWMEIAGHYLSPRANESTPVFDVDLQRFRYIPKQQDGGQGDTIIYPPGDSEYMNQPALNYDILEMLNQRNRREYEEYLRNLVDPTNIDRTSPAYQQQFHMKEGLKTAQKGLANLSDDAAKALNNKALPKLAGHSLPVPKNNVIKNISYFQQLLDNTAYAPKQRQYLQSIINTVKKQGSKASDRQYNILQGLKSGNRPPSGFGPTGTTNISSIESLKKAVLPDWMYEQMRFATLPELNNPSATEVLDNFMTRINTPEGQRRLKDLGITETDVFDKLKIVSDPNTMGQYWMNKIGLNPDLPDFRTATRHEIEHSVQDAYNRSRIKEAQGNVLERILALDNQKKLKAAKDHKTSIDKSLEALELRKTPQYVDWDALKENRGIRNPSNYFDYLSDKQRATDYFTSGSKGREKSPFLAEVQQYMMDQGIIPKTSYTEVTPEMVKNTFIDSMFDETGKGKYLRLFNIMKPSENNYKLISKNLNKMLAVPAAILLSEGLSQEEDGGTIDLELTPEEIKAYQDGGYIVEEIDDPSVPELNKAQGGGLVKAGEKLLRAADIGTLGTLNTLAKTFLPVKINPAHIPTFGAMMGERSMVGPFTGSPLNMVPGYGKDLGKEMASDEAFRYFGDSLNYVKLFNELNSAHGPLLRMGKGTILSDKGQWFEQGTPNASYTSVFGVRANPSAPGSNLRYMPKGNRNGVLIGDISTENSRIINPRDPGIEFYRRLPFSQNVSKVDLDNPWDWKNYGGNMQSLLERYGYASLYAAALAGMGYALPQEYLDENINIPIKEGYNEYIKPGIDEIYNGFVPRKYRSSKYEEPQQYLKGGALPKAQLGLVRSASNISKALRPTSEFRGMMGALEGADDLMRGFTPASVNIAKPIIPKVEDVDDADFFKMLNQMSNKDSRAALKDFLKGIDAKNPVQFEEIVKPNWALNKGLEDDVLPPGGLTDVGGSSLVQYGDDISLGNPWYYVDPNDYKGLDWRKEGMKDSYEDFFKKFPNMRPASGGSGPINIGDFDFNPWSPGYNYMQRMKSMLTGPQRTLSTEDFFTDRELMDLADQEYQWQKAREAYEEMYPQSGEDMLMGLFTGNKSREESFENLFPNVSRPNFRSKFTTPEQEKLLSQNKYVPSIKNRGLLNEHALRNFMDIDYPQPQRDILPIEQQQINELRSGEDWLSAGDPKMVVSEMRGALGVSLEDIDKATPEQLEKWRQQIINRAIQQKQARLNSLLENPYKTKNFYGDLNFNQSGGEHNLGDEIDLTDEEVKELERMGYTLQRI